MAAPFVEEVGEDLIYPETDGKPMAENTLQFQWIVIIEGGIDAQFRDNPDVFVAGDLFWYPVRGQPGIVTAPDILVVFGRPKGHRRSYRQWREGGVGPQVVFEIKSPGNTAEEMDGKFEFYEQYGVEEYYIYDPDNIVLTGYLRHDGLLQEIDQMDGWVSPRLQIRFDMSGPELVIWGQTGQRFLTFVEMAADREQALKIAIKERHKAEKERHKAEKERHKAEKERQLREEAQAEVKRLAARLRELGIDPD